MATLASTYWSQNWTASAAPLNLITVRMMADYDKTIAGRAILPDVPDGSKETNHNGNTSNRGQPIPFVFPLCNPYGCEDVRLAPIHCENCRKLETGFAVFGMFLLSFLIVLANFLVIRVILRNPSLKRRHGCIKLSMATSDLLVGLLVIPAAIANLFFTLYYPLRDAEPNELHPIKKRNSTASVIFGVVAIISVVSSLYNLVLLSADRFLAIARPLKHRSGRYFPRRSLWLSISAVWVFAVVLSMVPTFFPEKVSYEMDLSTFFFVQRVRGNSESMLSSVYIGVIIGGPYAITILLIMLTALYTCKSLRVRNRLSTRGNMTKSAMQRKCERRNRIKMIQAAYPDALVEDDVTVASIKDYRGSTETKNGCRRESSIEERRNWLSWWKNEDCVFGNRPRNTNNNSNESEDSPRFQRTRDQISIVREILKPTRKKLKTFNRKTHVRVFKMLIAMVVCFTLCVLPYIIVMLILSNPEKANHRHMTSAYIFAVYMLFANSLMNFLIYNFLHPEFRLRLVKMLREDFGRSEQKKASNGVTFTTTAASLEESMPNRVEESNEFAGGTSTFS